MLCVLSYKPHIWALRVCVCVCKMSVLISATRFLIDFGLQVAQIKFSHASAALWCSLIQDNLLPRINQRQVTSETRESECNLIPFPDYWRERSDVAVTVLIGRCWNMIFWYWYLATWTLSSSSVSHLQPHGNLETLPSSSRQEARVIHTYFLCLTTVVF